MARGKKSKGRPLVVEDARGDHGGAKVRARSIPNTIDRIVDRVMAVQRPAVLAHLNGIAAKHPDATTGELTAILERRYLAAVTASGTASGAVAVIPAVGTVSALALSGAETVAFLEATALFGQSIAELHGVPIDDPERARGLVLALMLGREGSAIVRQWGLEAIDEDVTRSGYWGELVSASVPSAIVGPVINRLKNAFLKHFAKRYGASVIGKALPYGIGAAIGGIGNHMLGRRVIAAARAAFPIEDAAAEAAEEKPQLAPVRALRAVD